MNLVDVKSKKKTVNELKAEITDHHLSLNVGELKKFLQDVPDDQYISFPFVLEAKYVNLKDTRLTDVTFRKSHSVQALIYEDGSEKEHISDDVSCQVKGYTCKVYEVRECGLFS